jgi:hypothetical protein
MYIWLQPHENGERKTVLDLTGVVIFRYVVILEAHEWRIFR